MFDVKKIDSYFDNSSLLNRQEDSKKNRRAVKVRLVKLLLPCFAAIILGLMILLPYMKTTQTPLNFDITMPKKGELEKLHMENTKFNITDTDNKISNFTADNIDETEPQSRVIKLVNPKGKIPLKNGGFADMHSPSGFFDQANNKITMLEDVFINYNDEVNIKTKNVTYDFNTHKGHGSSPIVADGIYGKLKAQSYEADTKNEIYTLYGNSLIDINRKEGNIVIKSEEKIILYKTIQKAVAKGNASISNAGNIIYADKIEVKYVDVNKQPEITDMKAYGSVKMLSEKGTVYADRATYNPKSGFVELFDNVIIEQNENKIFGDYATTDLNSGVSRIVTKNSSSRVHGIFKNLEKSIKKEGR